MLEFRPEKKHSRFSEVFNGFLQAFQACFGIGASNRVTMVPFQIGFASSFTKNRVVERSFVSDIQRTVKDDVSEAVT